MIDYAKITVKAGDGGSGTGSFTRVKSRKRRGKADGGSGGEGGNVYLEASADLSTLEPFRFVKHYEAEKGQPGLSNLRKGARGQDLMVKVPMGTLAKVEDTTYDLVEASQKVLIAKGGEPGKGNAHLRDEFGRRPLKGEKGQEGETKELTLELKLIADIGLIGLPNAGKSTLLSKLTSAKPEIANYPFTTLEPNLGVFEISGKRIIIADIPGLIEGASKGKGLGDLFLRHIERTKTLFHLIDTSAYTEKESAFQKAWQDYQAIRNELRTKSTALTKKKEVIVLTKLDLADKTIVEEITKEFGKKRKRVIAISAETEEGLGNLTSLISKA